MRRAQRESSAPAAYFPPQNWQSDRAARKSEPLQQNTLPCVIPFMNQPQLAQPDAAACVPAAPAPQPAPSLAPAQARGPWTLTAGRKRFLFWLGFVAVFAFGAFLRYWHLGVLGNMPRNSTLELLLSVTSTANGVFDPIANVYNGPSSSVPEPGALAILLLGTLPLVLRSRPRCAHRK